MTVPRLGCASIKISFSDAKGLLVEHGSTGEVLQEIAPEDLEHGDWDRFIWNGIFDLMGEAAIRKMERSKVNG